tara:strand:- start:1803 stop:3335 length:1533 start_codon:yes stop_codon:yes gene_type:complete
MITNLLSTRSLLRQFLAFNLFIFLILGFFTFLYLLAIEPELINKKSKKHQNIIENIKSNLINLKIKPNENNLENFLYKSNFILDEVDQIRFFNTDKKIIVDSSVIDINKRSFYITERIETFGINETLNQDQSKIKLNNISKNLSPFLKDINLKLNQKYFITSENKNNNLIIHTSSLINFPNDRIIITISEISNEIIVAVEERKNFVLRSVLIAAIVIMIFSLFLNNYIIKPIRSLNFFAKQISYDNPKSMNKLGIEFNKRDDEIGNLSNSLSDMTNKLYQRIELAERFSSDLTHEIRNPLASLKGASDLLNLTKDENQKKKLLRVLSNDVERIERLITDYSQVLKDEATQSRAVAKNFDLVSLLESIIEDFNLDTINQKKNIKFLFENPSKINKAIIFGIESRIEQVIANLLDNAVSFSPSNSEIIINLFTDKNDFKILIKDQGPGFDENNLDKVFERFYSDRPDDKERSHSGLGLNIVKNIIDSHKGLISVYNKSESEGAIVDITLPSV